MSSFYNQLKTNISRRCLWRYLKYSAPKLRASWCYTNSLKMNVFQSEWLKLCLWGYQTNTIHFCRHIFYIFNSWRVILVKPRQFIWHVQPTTTCEPWHMPNICPQDLILQAWKPLNVLLAGPTMVLDKEWSVTFSKTDQIQWNLVSWHSNQIS